MQRGAQIVYRVPRTRRGWELHEETLPESVAHSQTVDLLLAILAYWARSRTNVQVVRSLAVRWEEEEPRIGVDPDVAVFSPAPPGFAEIGSVRTWLAGHAPPLVAIEVVSENNPHKDYVVAPDKYASSGTRELWIFDPLLAGPTSHGGPWLLQVWQRDEHSRFVRAYAGDGPAYSEALSAHLVIVGEPRVLRIASDPDGGHLWPTGEEAGHAATEAERAAKERALAKVAELEALLREKTDR